MAIRELYVSVKCVVSMPTRELPIVCRCYKSAVICPDNQASFLYPRVVSCKNSTCTMNIWRNIRPTLTAQLTVSVVNNRVIWCLYNDDVRCFPVASHMVLQSGGNHNFNDKVQLHILDG